MSNIDLTELLRNWSHQPGRINARLISGDDGRTKIQMRVDLGILQMEAEGRPDGAQPHGCESLLAYHWQRIETYANESGTTAGLTITSKECAGLREEAVQQYYRYVALYALQDLESVIRDTQRNLEILNLCRDFGESENDRTVLEQFRPQIIMMRARCEAELALHARQSHEAKAAIDRGLEEIRAAYNSIGAGDQFEQSNEVQLLRGMRDVLVPKLPASQRQELLERLRAAIDAENYELAAILRDELKML